MRAEAGALVRRTRATARQAWIAVLCAHAVACGEDVVLGQGRAAADAAAGRDAGDADAPAFSAPAPIATLSIDGATDDDPSLSADLTLLFFNSEREGGAGEEDIWFSSRDAPGGTWQPALPAPELNTVDRETGIALAPDGLSIFWSSDRPGGDGGLDVYAAERDSRGAGWSSIRRVAELSSAADDLISAISAGGRTALIARRAERDDDYDLFAAQRADVEDAWSAPEPIAELNSNAEESDGFAIERGLGLLFTRGQDLQLARRDAPGAVFGAPVALDALNSGSDDRDAWATDDLSYVVFSSDRSGSYLLYEASR